MADNTEPTSSNFQDVIKEKAEEVIEKKSWVDSEPPVDTAALIAELQEKVKALEG